MKGACDRCMEFYKWYRFQELNFCPHCGYELKLVVEEE